MFIFIKTTSWDPGSEQHSLINNVYNDEIVKSGSYFKTPFSIATIVNHNNDILRRGSY